MSEFNDNFIDHLLRLKERDKGAMARLRRSLAHDPGTDPQVYPYVEPFVGTDRQERDPRRLALYVVAGLYAMNPCHSQERTLAEAYAAHATGNGSQELRFIALLGAEPERLPVLLRQAVALLNGRTYDHARLLQDLERLLHPFGMEGRNRVRQRWAREFYRIYDASHS